MSLNTSLSIASSGLSAVQYELAVASQNISNATTPGYVREISNVASRDAGGQGSGVVIQLTSRAVNEVLQNSLYVQNATVAALAVTTNALNAVSAVQGSTSAGASASNTLADNLGNLQNGFTALDANPSSAVQQQSIVGSASNLAGSIRSLSDTYQTQRQNAQQAIPSEVDQINTSLSTIGSLSQDIMRQLGSGADTADLENQRAAAMSTLSSSLNVKFTETAAGDMLVSTASGLALPTRLNSGPLSTTRAVIGVADAHPGSIPDIKLNGLDVTTSLTGGSLGANITLRDTTLPRMQGELDAFSSVLATRFSNQGLTLFTDGAGKSPGASPALPPPGGQLGLSGSIQVNPAVTANAALVRDGTQAVQDPTAGAPVVPGAVLTGASAFTPNPSGGPAGFTTLISRVLDHALGATLMTGVNQPLSTSAGLGVNGTLSAPYDGAGDLVTLATTLTSSQAQTIDGAASQQTTQIDIQTTLQGKLASSSGVSVDNEMANVVALQNAYESNAKVISAVRSMFSALLAAIN